MDIRQRRTATVRVTNSTELAKEWVRADLETSHVDIKTVPIGREVASPPDIRIEGDTTIIPVLEEILVVEKRLYLKEELHVTRRTEMETIEEPVTLRKQTISVERIEDNKENQR